MINIFIIGIVIVSVIVIVIVIVNSCHCHFITFIVKGTVLLTLVPVRARFELTLGGLGTGHREFRVLRFGVGVLRFRG